MFIQGCMFIPDSRVQSLLDCQQSRIKLYNRINFPTLSIGQPKASEHHSFTLIFTCHYKRIVCGWFSSRKLKSRRKRLANTLEHENELSDPLHLCTFTYPKVTKGQSKLVSIYEIVNQPKIATEKFERFLP